jgi:hypothetical protein
VHPGQLRRRAHHARQDREHQEVERRAVAGHACTCNASSSLRIEELIRIGHS